MDFFQTTKNKICWTYFKTTVYAINLFIYNSLSCSDHQHSTLYSNMYEAILNKLRVSL